VGTDLVLDLDVALDVGALALRAKIATASAHIAIVGPSGAGKSTLLRVLAGLEPATRGHVAFRGERWREAGRGDVVPPHRRRVGWVPQDVRLFPHRSVLDNLRFAGGSPADAAALAARFGVDGLLHRRPRHLSGGEAQRVALARALLAKPRLLLLDEPFAALDRVRRADLSNALRDVLAASDVALVLVSHDERDVASLADEVFEMSGGTVAPLGAQRSEVSHSGTPPRIDSSTMVP
jgi:molybdate transport system ATP-binding protein